MTESPKKRNIKGESNGSFNRFSVLNPATNKYKEVRRKAKKVDWFARCVRWIASRSRRIKSLFIAFFNSDIRRMKMFTQKVNIRILLEKGNGIERSARIVFFTRIGRSSSFDFIEYGRDE